MSTKHSPLRQLKAEADKIAAHLKAAERGDVTLKDGARAKPAVTVGVVMDDKVLKIALAWETIRATSEAGLSAWIVKQMRDERERVN